jgi:hypothetical protein
MRTPPKLSYPQLDLPQFPLVAVFRAVAQVLKTDPVFSRVCDTFLCWDGSVWDAWPPSYSLCPYCRISPFPTSSDWATEIQHKSPVTVHLELATKGTDFDQLGNFWGAVHTAIFQPGNPTAREAVINRLQAAGVTKPTVRMAAFGSEADDDNNVMLIGRGTIEFGSLLLS